MLENLAAQARQVHEHGYLSTRQNSFTQTMLIPNPHEYTYIIKILHIKQ